MKITAIVIILCIVAIVVYNLLPEPKLPDNAVITRLVVLKSKRKLYAYSGDSLLKVYTISLGRNPEGAKQYEGDKRTPEGLYTINDKNPNSGYHLNLGVSYPNAEDNAKAKALGKSAGGNIKIHGLRNGSGWIGKFHRWTDWTMGCIAVTNSEMDELFHHTPIGTPIEIKP